MAFKAEKPVTLDQDDHRMVAVKTAKTPFWPFVLCHFGVILLFGLLFAQIGSCHCTIYDYDARSF